MSAPFLHVVIEGEPEPGARPRAKLHPAMAADAMLAVARRARSVQDLFRLFHPRIHPTHASDKWRKRAEALLRVERQRVLGSRPVAGVGEPIELFLLLVFELPRSKWRKREAVARSWQVSQRAGDFDNLAKPLCDAANGTLWPDDCQVARAVVEKVVGAQGEASRLELLARRLVASPYETVFSAVEAGRAWAPSGRAANEELQLWRECEEGTAAEQPQP